MTLKEYRAKIASLPDNLDDFEVVVYDTNGDTLEIWNVTPFGEKKEIAIITV